jgi:hypothetical protein
MGRPRKIKMQEIAVPTVKKLKRTHYHIANTDSGDIVYPRPGKGGIKATSIVFPSGQAIPIEASEWHEMREKTGIRNFTNAGVLVEVNKDGNTPISERSASSMPIPEHLQRDDEEIGTGPVKAKVRQKNVILI